MLVISPATAHDLPALERIERSATDLYYEAGFSPAAIAPRGAADLRALIGQTTLLLARDGDDVVGYVSYYPRGPYLHLEEIAVRRDRQRRGHGRRLAQQVLAAAAADPQCSHISLVAFTRAGWAIRLYTGLGFRPLAGWDAPLPQPELLAELLSDPAGEPRQVMIRAAEA